MSQNRVFPEPRATCVCRRQPSALGARLLDRTTRRLNVTEIGALVYERCERILDEIDAVQQSTSALQTAPRGVLHLAAPLSFGITQLGPALADYLSRYPEVVVDATLMTALLTWSKKDLTLRSVSAR